MSTITYKDGTSETVDADAAAAYIRMDIRTDGEMASCSADAIDAAIELARSRDYARDIPLEREIGMIESLRPAVDAARAAIAKATGG